MIASEDPAVAVPITLPSFGAFQRSATANDYKLVLNRWFDVDGPTTHTWKYNDYE